MSARSDGQRVRSISVTTGGLIGASRNSQNRRMQ